MGSKKPRVLLLEDDKAFSDLLRKILQGMGYEVHAYNNPTVCPVYNDHDSQCPKNVACADVILSDIMMPEMNGIEFFKLQRLRGCKALASNKALMSAVMTKENIAEANELGCRFFKKPFKIALLKTWLKECEQRLN
jgi:CheY-like chemotaxis protein